MSTLIPFDMFVNSFTSEGAIQEFQNACQEARAAGKAGIIVDLRTQHSNATQFLKSIADEVESNLQILFLVSCSSFTKISNLKATEGRLHVVIRSPAELKGLVGQISGARPTLVIQSDSKSSLISLLRDETCQKILNEFDHSFLPDISEQGLCRFSGHEYYQVLKKWKLKRDYRLPLCLTLDFNTKLKANNVPNNPKNLHAQKPEISFVLPTDKRGASVLQMCVKHIAESAAFAGRKVEILVVLNDGAELDEKLKIEFSRTNEFVFIQIVETQAEEVFLEAKSKRKIHSFFAGQARNIGARYARAEALCFIDSDIIVQKEFVEKLVENLRSNEVVQFKRIYKGNKKLIEPKYWLKFYDSSRWTTLSHFWRYTCTYALAVPKNLFLHSGQFQNHFQTYGFEDVDLGFRLSQLSKKFILVDHEVFHPQPTQSELSRLYSVYKFFRTSLGASLFFLDHLNLEIGFFARNYLRWEHLSSRASLCNVFFQDKHRVISK